MQRCSAESAIGKNMRFAVALALRRCSNTKTPSWVKVSGFDRNRAPSVTNGLITSVKTPNSIDVLTSLGAVRCYYPECTRRVGNGAHHLGKMRMWIRSSRHPHWQWRTATGGNLLASSSLPKMQKVGHSKSSGGQDPMPSRPMP